MNRIQLFIMLLASLTLGACRSDDDGDDNVVQGYTVTTVTDAPEWTIDWGDSQSRPDWQEPVIGQYENFCIMLLKIEDALVPYTSSKDMMALFVNNEIRGLATPTVSMGADNDEAERPSFLLKAYGNETNNQQMTATLCYYCDRLKQVFKRTGTIIYQTDEVYGIDSDFIPHFTYGSAKYPVVMFLDMTNLLLKANLQPAPGDLFAAFVGDECRGVSQASTGSLSLTIYGREEGENVTVKYYQAATGKVYSFSNATLTKQEISSIVIL